MQCWLFKDEFPGTDRMPDGFISQARKLGNQSPSQQNSFDFPEERSARTAVKA